jgi:hypothetical protein
MLLRTLWLSLDPYMRGRMSDAPAYAKPVGVGEVMEGGTVSEVVTSNVHRFAADIPFLIFNVLGFYRNPASVRFRSDRVVFQDSVATTAGLQPFDPAVT